MIDIKIDRDSVHAGDDIAPHFTTLRVPSSATVGEFLQQVRGAGFLASISGGEATWVIDCPEAKGGTIGVLAQQWQEPRLAIPANTPVSTLISLNRPSFYFRYRAQADPQSVFSTLLSGTELPGMSRPTPAGAAKAGAGKQGKSGLAGIFNWLNLAILLWGGLGVVSFVPVLYISAFLFDAPGSTENTGLWMFFWSLVSFPVICVISAIAILAVKKWFKRLAFIISLVPVLSLGLTILFMFLMTATSGKHSSTMQQEGHALGVSGCMNMPVVDGGDGLPTTGCGMMRAGINVTGATKSTAEAHNWQVTIAATNRSSFAVENDGKSCPQIRILDLSGKVVEAFEKDNANKSCLAGMTETHFYYFNPPVPGTYIIRLTTPGTPGAYWLKFQ